MEETENEKLVEFSPCHIQSCNNQSDDQICSFHYNYQHQTVNKTCGIRAKVGETFRCCPNPSLMEKYLRATTEFDSIITEEDKVCPNHYAKYTEVTNVHKF